MAAPKSKPARTAVQAGALTDAGVDGGARADRNFQSEDRSSVITEPDSANVVPELVWG
jgi:hypothetical protein